MADIAASVLARLKNKAAESGRSYQLCLQLFCQEEFLRRLEKSKYAENLVLKGGLFLYSLTDFDSRVTVDVDFLLRKVPNTPEQLKSLLEEIIRYNCSILDLYDRSIIASITDRHITSELAIRTLQKALDSQPMRKGELLLHSDQGAQYTSKAFVEYCESVHVTQSMSKAGCPYDNAPMERYFNTLKNECTNLYEFRTEEALYQTVEEFAYVTYNHVRPHSFNGYQTPYQARIA